MNGHSLERVGAWCGVAFVVLFLATFFMPTPPDINATTDEVRQNLAEYRTLHLVSTYLGGLAIIAFVGFLAALWHRLREREPDHGGFSVVVLGGGMLMAAIILLSAGTHVALIHGADADPASIAALSLLDNTSWIGFTFATVIMLAGVAVTALATKALPRWLGWLAAVVALGNLSGTLAVFDPALESAAGFGYFFVGLLGLLIWMLATSIVMLRAVGLGVRRARPTRTPQAPTVRHA